MVTTPRRTAEPRWPAYVMVVLSLGYAVGKATYAAQGRMGFPTGPVVSPEEHVRYAHDVMDVALSQWMGAATGALGALVALATVTRAGQRLPRWVTGTALAVMAVGVGAGAGVLAVDGFIGVGIGWRWPHGVVGLTTLLVLALMTRAWLRADRQHNGPHGTAG